MATFGASTACRTGRGALGCGSKREVAWCIPALGLAWASCVGTRLFLTKETARCDETRAQRPVLVQVGSGAKQLRGMQVVFSPELRQVKTHFVIETRGCVGVDVGSADLGLG